MTNFVTGVMGLALFLAFVGGLAESIGATPFMVVTGIVGLMALVDFLESLRGGKKNGG